VGNGNAKRNTPLEAQAFFGQGVGYHFVLFELGNGAEGTKNLNARNRNEG
jgi:hypothetical protein